MKIKIALTFLAPLAISLGLITDLSPARAEEPAGKPVGEKELSEKLRFYRSLKSFKVPFKQTKVLQELHLKLRSEGSLEVSKPQKIVWQVIQPAPLRVTLDEKEIRIVSGIGTEQQIQILKRADAAVDKNSEALATLVAWLSLDAHLLSTQYEITQQSGGSWRFKPKKGSSDVFEQLEMRLNPSGHLSQLNIHEKSGDQLLIEFGKPKIQ